MENVIVITTLVKKIPVKHLGKFFATFRFGSGQKSTYFYGFSESMEDCGGTTTEKELTEKLCVAVNNLATRDNRTRAESYQ